MGDANDDQEDDNNDDVDDQDDADNDDQDDDDQDDDDQEMMITRKCQTMRPQIRPLLLRQGQTAMVMETLIPRRRMSLRTTTMTIPRRKRVRPRRDQTATTMETQTRQRIMQKM